MTQSAIECPFSAAHGLTTLTLAYLGSRSWPERRRRQLEHGHPVGGISAIGEAVGDLVEPPVQPEGESDAIDEMAIERSADNGEQLAGLVGDHESVAARVPPVSTMNLRPRPSMSMKFGWRTAKPPVGSPA